MRRKYVLTMFMIGIVIGKLFAQNGLPAALKIGEKVPDMDFNIIHPTKQTIKLSDFKGKVVLLYFWSTSCTSCIKKFPKLDSLQAIFGDKIKIILVDPKLYGDTEQKVKRILDIYKKNYGKTLGLSSAIDDTIGIRYFPHVVNSHFAWIDRQGVFKKTTGYATHNDIELMLADKDPESLEKDDFLVSRNNETLFTFDKPYIKFKSMFTGYLEGLDNFKKQKTEPFLLSDPKKGIRFINMGILQILNSVYAYYPNPNLVIVEGYDRYRLVCPDNQSFDSWSKDNAYCYELIAPDKNKEECRQQIIADIEQIFRIKTSIEKRKVVCWVIKMDEQQMKKRQKKNKSLEDLFSLSQISDQFYQLDIPVVAETKFNVPLFASQSSAYVFEKLNEADLRKFIKDNGLTLVKEEREQKVFVVKKVE